MSFTEISPFYEPGREPPCSTPPPALSQTPINLTNGSSSSLTQRNVGNLFTSPDHRTSPYPSPSRRKADTVNTVTTTPRSVTIQSPPRSPISDESESRLHGRAPIGDHDQQRTSSTQQPPEEIPREGSFHLIPKPNGEVSRPGRGGYNLEKALKWERKVFRSFKDYVKVLVDEHLDSSRSFSSQSSHSLKLVRTKAAERFAILLNYDNCWPVSDAIRQQLKYSSERARIKGIRFDAEEVRRRRLGLRS
ncbi:hypothetical protein M413DRAFT_32992 [Hebeloma cylindrosporum]|uniref:Uncharacterized protein n=1 Tax=Hebeloma cylindrosporum TaxID=76867 RepID=A0A0C3BDD3_HEBCY|nr:hypothetical protein M413DRAFT_32987 [Hebeloma cylindrosporum h7]KIM34830.1 hypothetical protein M413DRAFT_32992 [Hebeloma cylindrosporum h7]